MQNIIEKIDQQIEVVKAAYENCNKAHEQYYKGMYDGLCELRRVIEYRYISFGTNEA